MLSSFLASPHLVLLVHDLPRVQPLACMINVGNQVRVVGKKGLHSPTTQPMLRAIELKNEIIAKLILASRENAA